MAAMPPALIRPLARGVGFIAGALAGYWLARLLGIDVLRDLQGGKGVLAAGLIGLGGGIGLAAARRWCAQRGYEQPGK
ncbi:hypothetical protein [Comamonas badia]|uniref:hypothetical protein n=1 Tax=Comamonas badia TaxID=265291 RepID=UPI00041787FF|nr:hypothetical protein [Comamonas badia]